MTTPPAQTVRDVGERFLIARLTARLPSRPDWLPISVGDDAAVVEPARGELDVITTDSLIEGVHFRREWTAPRAIGHKALAVNLSDLAAMGAEPRICLLSLALPDTFGVAEFDDVVDGLLALATATGTHLAGGNITRSPGPLVVDVTAVGSVRRRRVLTRSGGRPGDGLYVTGSLGGASAGLALLAAGANRDELAPAQRACIHRYEQPTPRLRAGRSVGRQRAASAAIDLSDGLAAAATQLAQASGTGALIEAAALPIDPGVAIAGTDPVDPTNVALTGGEDYELLFAVPQRSQRAFRAAMRRFKDLPATRIGELTRARQCLVRQDGTDRALPDGFQHFPNRPNR